MTASAAKLGQVIADLYALPLSEFTRARNARAKALRVDGDRAAADAVATLPKPSASASAVNQLARLDAAELIPIRELAAKFAGEGGRDRTTLAALTRERRTVVGSLVKRAAAIAAKQSQALGASAARELESTLYAAIADEDALSAVTSGRLVRALTSDGLEPVDLDGAVAGEGVPRRRAATRATDTASARTVSLAHRRAQKAVESARRQIDSLQSDASKLDERAAQLDDLRAQQDARASDLQRQIDALERDAADLNEQTARLDRDRATNRRAAAAAEKQLQSAEKQLDP